MENVVTVLFEVESEAYKAFSELRAKPATETYLVAEAALLKKEAGQIRIVESADSGLNTADDTATGILVGSIAGILAGPLGVMLGASAGALVGATVDALDADDDASLIEQVASKLYDGETAIVTLVQEQENFALDAAFESYATTIIRQDAGVVASDVNRAREVEEEAARIARREMRASKMDKLQAKVEAHRANVQAKFDELRERHAENKAEIRDNINELLGTTPAGDGAVVAEQVEDDTLEGVSGGSVSVNAGLSADVIARLDAYITQCIGSHMTVTEAISGLISLSLSPSELLLATEYTKKKYTAIKL